MVLKTEKQRVSLLPALWLLLLTLSTELMEILIFGSRTLWVILLNPHSFDVFFFFLYQDQEHHHFCVQPGYYINTLLVPKDGEIVVDLKQLSEQGINDVVSISLSFTCFLIYVQNKNSFCFCSVAESRGECWWPEAWYLVPSKLTDKHISRFGGVNSDSLVHKLVSSFFTQMKLWFFFFLLFKFDPLVHWCKRSMIIFLAILIIFLLFL